MPSPLFPPKDAPVIIQQGSTGDCYLLAGLDCIFNAGFSGYNIIKSKFKAVDGGIELRIKRHSASKFLEEKKQEGLLEGKYLHRHDLLTDEDVFFISNERLDEIDRTSAVESNSLAVKVFERISSYYFQATWAKAPSAASAAASAAPKIVQSSIEAHDMDIRFSGSETEFIANLLGLHAEEYDEQAIDFFMQLRTILNVYPIYISMDWGKGLHGVYHERHALRVHKIIPNPERQGGYEVVLVNPWDNRAKEIYGLDYIKKRNPKFAVFSLSQAHHELIKLLTTLKTADAGLILSRPDLFNMMIEIQHINPSLNGVNVMHCVELYKKMPQLCHIFQLIGIEDKRVMMQCMMDSGGSEEAFKAAYIQSHTVFSSPPGSPPIIPTAKSTKYPSSPSSTHRVKSPVMTEVDLTAISLIKAIPVSFEKTTTESAIERHKTALFKQLSIIKADAQRKMHRLEKMPKPLNHAIELKVKEIKDAAQQSLVCCRVHQYLDDLGLREQLAIIAHKSIELRQGRNLAAAEALENLIEVVESAQTAFIQSPSKRKLSMDCKRAILDVIATTQQTKIPDAVARQLMAFAKIFHCYAKKPSFFSMQAEAAAAQSNDQDLLSGASCA